MPQLRRPSDAEIATFARRQDGAAFTYPEVGATAAAPLPSGYRIDRATYPIGRGAAAFHGGVAALRAWRHYDDPAGRIRVCAPKPVLDVGATLVMLARHLGVWTLSGCRIVYVIDEPRRFAFAYGTLEHVVRGEERFELRLADDDGVTLELTAFSAPALWLARLAAPLTRRFQREGGESYARALAASI